ncbi:response regulator [bacterium]|nr:response regulator [bacterium]
MSQDITLLIVDDDAMSLEYFNSLLIGFDIKTQTAMSVGEAKNVIIQDYLPDIVITDIVMEKETGLDLLLWIKNSYPHIPVIVSTGFASKETAIEALKLGATDFFEKSDRLEKIQKSVEHVIKLVKHRRQMEAMRERTGKMDRLATLGVMTSTIIHDIKNPLFKVDIKLKQAAKKLTTDLDTSAKKIDEAQEVLKSVFEIIKSQLTHLRGGEVSLRPTSVNKMLDDAISIAIPNLSNYGTKLIREIPDNDLSIPCSEIQIIQVLANLLNNAAQAIQDLDERWVKISLVDHKDSVEITVTDSGTGIPAELQDKIFEVLFTTKQDGEGTGLGLGIAKNIILQHHGRLTLNKESPNTQFIVQLLKNPPNISSTK